MHRTITRPVINAVIIGQYPATEVHKSIEKLAYDLWSTFGKESNAALDYWLWAKELFCHGKAKDQGKKLEKIRHFARIEWERGGCLPNTDFSNWISAVHKVHDFETSCKRSVGL